MIEAFIVIKGDRMIDSYEEYFYNFGKIITEVGDYPYWPKHSSFKYCDGKRRTLEQKNWHKKL